MQAHIAARHDPAPAAGIEPLGFIVGGYDAAGVGHVKQVWPYGGGIQTFARRTTPAERGMAKSM